MDKAYTLLREQQPKLCVFSTATREGIPASAVVAYAVDFEGELIFATHTGTQKWKNLSDNPYASFVTGWDFTKPNIQCRGKAFIITEPSAKQHYSSVFYSENPFAKKFESDSTIFIVFKPEWIRVTDMTVKPMSVKEFIPHMFSNKRQREIERASTTPLRN